MALHIISFGKRKRNCINFNDGRALLFFQTFPSFFLVQIGGGDLVEGRFFLKLSCIAHSIECGRVSSGFCAPLFVSS